MTAEEWKQVERTLDSYMYLPVVIKADGYFLKVCTTPKGVTIIGVDGFKRSEYTEQDCEERRRFMQRRENEGKVTYTYYWDKFDNFKNHLIKNNKEVSLAC